MAHTQWTDEQKKAQSERLKKMWAEKKFDGENHPRTKYKLRQEQKKKESSQRRSEAMKLSWERRKGKLHVQSAPHDVPRTTSLSSMDKVLVGVVVERAAVMLAEKVLKDLKNI